MQIRSVLTGLLLVLTFSAHAGVGSAYTEINLAPTAARGHCGPGHPAYVSRTNGGDFFSINCWGLGGYAFSLSGGDVFHNFKIEHAGHLIHLPDSLSFSENSRARVEWRYEGPEGGTARPARYRALIYEADVQRTWGRSSPQPPGPGLVVVRLQGAGTCVVGRVPPGQHREEKARLMADDLSLPCLER